VNYYEKKDKTNMQNFFYTTHGFNSNNLFVKRDIRYNNLNTSWIQNVGTIWTTYLSMKEGCLFVLFCLFCTNEIHQTRMLQIMFLVSLESSWGGGGALAWFHGIWTCGVEVLEYWMTSSLKIKLNRSWKFQRNWNVPLVFLERS